MYRNLVTIFAFFVSPALSAQQKVVHTQMLWFNYNNIITLDSKWSISNDIQIRTREWTSHWSQFALRSGALYKLNNRFTLGAGFTWFGNVRYYNDEPVVADEWRPWEEISYQVNGRNHFFLQRVRLEQRFLQIIVEGKKTNEFEKRQRLRYRFEFAFPIAKKKIEVHFGNEVMGNLNYLSDNRFFDQNRTFVIANLRLSASTFFQYQYIKIFQWQPARNTMENQDVFRFGIHQQIK